MSRGVKQKSEVEKLDFIKSDQLSTQKNDDILNTYGNLDNAIGEYNTLLSGGYPRSASFLMQKIMGVAIEKNKDLAKQILLDNISQLTPDHMASDSNKILSKILEASEKPRIMFSSAHWLTGGMEQVMSSLFKELRRDYDIFLITPYHEAESTIPVPSHVTNIKVANNLFTQNFDSLALTYALLLDVDVVIGFMNMFVKQTNLYRLCEGTKIRTIASNHEYYFYPYKSHHHYHVIEKRLLGFKSCDAVVWSNNFNAAACAQYVDNCYVLGNPNTYQISEGYEKHSRSEKVVLCVGRFNDYVKRIDRVLETFSIVLKTMPDTKLVIVGKFDKDMIINKDGITVGELLNQLALPPDSINIVGESSNLAEFYKQADVFLLTSNSEGFGMVINEAACFGVPTVCNYIPGVEDIIEDGRNGYVTAQGDLKTMAEKVCEILTDEDLRNRLSENSKKMAYRYDVHVIGDDWRYLINTLISSKDGLNKKKLKDRFGFKIANQELFTNIIAQELNEIFYAIIEREDDSSVIADSKSMLWKIARLPKRYLRSVNRRGLAGTGRIISSKLLLIAKDHLKKN